jgi:hypothetical protein
MTLGPRLADLVGPAVLTVVGVFLAARASRLSERYNAWTTGVRERNPKFNGPPTPEMRLKNTAIMTRLFRFLGLWMIVLSAATLAFNLVSSSK